MSKKYHKHILIALILFLLPSVSMIAYALFEYADVSALLSLIGYFFAVGIIAAYWLLHDLFVDTERNLLTLRHLSWFSAILTLFFLIALIGWK